MTARFDPNDIVYEAADFDAVVVPPETTAPTKTAGPVGIGGWLIFPAVLIPLGLGYSFITGFVEGLAETPLNSEGLTVAIFILLAFLAFPAWLVRLAVTRSPRWPLVFFITYALLMAASFVMEASEGRTNAWYVIWILVAAGYLRKSVRVKNTFGRNL